MIVSLRLVCSYCPAGHVLTPRLSPAAACLLRQGGNRPRSGGPGRRDRSGSPVEIPAELGKAGSGARPGGLDQNCSPVAVRRPQTSPPRRPSAQPPPAHRFGGRRSCRFDPSRSTTGRSRPAGGRHHGNVYLREADLLPAIDSWLLLIFAPHRLDQTLSGAATSVLSHRGTRRPGVAERHGAAVRAIGPTHPAPAGLQMAQLTHRR